MTTLFLNAMSFFPLVDVMLMREMGPFCRVYVMDNALSILSGIRDLILQQVDVKIYNKD